MGLKIYKKVDGTKIDNNFIKCIYKETLKYFNLKDVFEIDITLVNEDEICKINAETRGINKITDVLSFPTVNFKFPFKKEDYLDCINPESNNIMLGDLILCEKRAREQAIEYNHSFDREVGFLVLHGILHLFGFDHMSEDEEKNMMQHANNILEGLKLTRDV